MIPKLRKKIVLYVLTIIVSAREYYMVSSCPLLFSRLLWLRRLVFFLHVGG
jgi:hypothetical protein